MTSSSYVWRPDFDALTATGHDSRGKAAELDKPKEALAASTLNTTAKDYARFVEAVLNGKGLKPAILREMETPEIALDPECRICIQHEPKQLSKNRSGDWDGALSAKMEQICCGIGEITAHSRLS